MFRQVPVLPVVLPIVAATFAALLWRLHRSGRLSIPRAGVALVICAYLGGVVANTVFPIYLDKPRSSAPGIAHVALVPFAGYEVADAAVNILIFVPLGFLVPLLARRLSWWRCLAIVACFSLAIELVQLTTSTLLGAGHITDVNDLIFNTIGGALGFIVFLVLARSSRAAGFIERFRWNGGAADLVPAPRGS